MAPPSRDNGPPLVTLDVARPIWDRFFLVAPLVLVGTREPDGGHDLAPKHLATPLSWQNHFGFVCTPSHGTYQNIRRTGEFTVSFPTAEQILEISLAASPRCDEGSKPALVALPTFAATTVDGVLVQGASLHLECRLHSIIDGFGINSLIAGTIVAAQASAAALRSAELDDQDVLRDSPLLAYVAPGRFAQIDASSSFPFPAGFRREPRP